MKSQLRDGDELLSQNVSLFLDKYFYSQYCEYFERVNDKERQIIGIDTIFSLNGKKYICDEKAAVRYRNLNTFASEISFINQGGQLSDGWLINKQLVNDSLMYVWLDDGAIEMALVIKDNVKRYLLSLGWDEEKLRLKSNRIRTNLMSENLGDIYSNGCRFTFSEMLVEKPVNVLIQRNNLIKLSDFHIKWMTNDFS